MTDTKKKVNLSYSGWMTYYQCPRKWKLHYLDRIRPEGDSSPLLFGLAIDEALNYLLLEKKACRTVELEELILKFQDNFTWDICKNSTWLKGDLDWDLFTDEQIEMLKDKSDDYSSWACLRIKGRLALETYYNEVLPRITEVHSVQSDIGGGRPGVIDAILSLDGDTKYIVDHKTTSKPYQGDSVKVSNQLALYAGELGISQAAYITLCKMPKKNKSKVCKKCKKDGSGTSFKTCHADNNGIRCHGTWDVSTDPKGICQIIKDTIPEAQQKLITTSLNETEDLIDSGHFPQNLSSCDKMFGKKCVFFEHCRTGSMSGLIKKPEGK